MSGLSGSLDIVRQTTKLISCNLGSKCEIIVSEVDAEGIQRVVHIENTSKRYEVGMECDVLPLSVFGDSKGVHSEIRNTPDGQIERVTGVALYNEHGFIVGSVTVIVGITDLVLVQNLLQEISSYSPHKEAIQCQDVNEMMDLIIHQAATVIGRPVAFMNRQDKKNFIKYLDERGVFQIKKSSERVAKFLDISKFTLYACLEETRTCKEEEEAEETE